MKVYGTSKNAYEFMSSYFYDIYHGVKISICRSSWTQLMTGIMHSSGHGTFLLNVFITEMCYFMEICNFI